MTALELEELKEAARKEVAKMKEVMQTLKVAESKKNEEEVVVLKKLADSYWIDAQHFLKEKKFLQAFEAAVIVWAYLDAGLHLGAFEVSEEVEKLFTV
jgi:hypothetical protein